MNTLTDFAELMRRAQAEAAPYRNVIQQARCRSCGNVHEREVGLMFEHAPGSWILVKDEATREAHLNAPILFQVATLAWCEACRSPAAAELTKSVREAVDLYANTTELAKALEHALEQFAKSRTKEHFHHASPKKS